MRNIKSKETEFLENLLLTNFKITLCPCIVQEVLQGVKSIFEWNQTKKMLLSQDIIINSSLETSVNAAHIYFTLRKKGITIRKPNDCLIAAYAISADIVLVHNDRDFDEIAKIFPLKIYE